MKVQRIMFLRGSLRFLGSKEYPQEYQPRCVQPKQMQPFSEVFEGVSDCLNHWRINFNNIMTLRPVEKIPIKSRGRLCCEHKKSSIVFRNADVLTSGRKRRGCWHLLQNVPHCKCHHLCPWKYLKQTKTRHHAATLRCLLSVHTIVTQDWAL